MIKKILYSFTAIAGAMMMASCELESSVYHAYNTTVFPKTEEDVNTLLVGGVYAPFRSNMFEGLFCSNNRGVQIYNDMCTDLGEQMVGCILV